MDSATQESSEGKAVVTVLAAVLERLVESNAHLQPDEDITKFHALKAPGISVRQYLERIHKYASCSTECFILALIYIDRLIQRNNFILSELNVHRVLVTSVLLAAKFFDDAYYNNAYYAKVGGVLTSEMNGLEVEFLFRINFSLHVTPDVFKKYQDELISHAIGAGLKQPAQEMSRAALESSMQVQISHLEPNPTGIDHSPHSVPLVSCEEKTELSNVDYSNYADPISATRSSLSHHDWSINSEAKADVHRHITPSPPNHQENSNKGISPAYSAPGGSLQEELTYAPISRPRNNSYPLGDTNFYPIITIDHMVHQRIQYPSVTQLNGNFIHRSDSLPCSHYNHRLSQNMCECGKGSICRCSKNGMRMILEPQTLR